MRHSSSSSPTTARIASACSTTMGRFTYVNRTLCKGTGYSEGELIGKQVTLIDPDWPAARFRSFFDDVHKTGPRRFESINRHRDGTSHPVEIGVSPVEIAGRRLLYANSRDITDRRAAAARVQLEHDVSVLAADPAATDGEYDRFLTLVPGRSARRRGGVLGGPDAQLLQPAACCRIPTTPLNAVLTFAPEATWTPPKRPRLAEPRSIRPTGVGMLGMRRGDRASPCLLERARRRIGVRPAGTAPGRCGAGPQRGPGDRSAGVLRRRPAARPRRALHHPRIRHPRSSTSWYPAESSNAI